ncbi:MAG TPA: carotenoid oxygenase family protein [Candidatus Binatia bacterium]|jgi:carotenoid cleavage dioxygenase
MNGLETGAEATASRQTALDARQYWINAWRPSTVQRSYRVTRIDGEIPRELHGTLYRNGPSQQVLPAEGYRALHLFDGDGLVHAFRFDDGRLDYTGRVVEHPCTLRERDEGRFCMNAIGVQVADPVDPFRIQPNTNVVFHGGKLMALVENAFPFEIDRRTLAPIGVNDFQGKMLGMSTTAHPKIDARTGQMIIHGYQPFEPYLQYYVVEPDGSCSLAEAVDAPYAVMAHDIAITEHYAIFIWGAVHFDGMALMNAGGFNEAISWKPELGLRFGVRRREAGAKTQWFTAPTPGFIFHPGNAYEDNGRIMMDAVTYRDGDALLDSLRNARDGRATPGFAGVPFLYELDLATGVCSERQLDERGAEFPRLDDRLVGYRNRYGYAALDRSIGNLEDTWATIVRYDRQGGANQVQDFGRWHWPSEPVFVPRSATSAEDDGFVLCTVYDGVNDTSFVAILDAADVGAKPLAVCHLEHRVPMGFHGSFAGGIV